MNYTDLIIGLGAGVLITLIVRAVNDARREKAEKVFNKDQEHKTSHRTFEWHISSADDRFKNIFAALKDIDARLSKLESKRK